MKLIKTVVDSAVYSGKRSLGSDGCPKWSRCVLWDEELKGFGLRITPTGKKSFVVLYRPEGSPRQRLMTLGSYGDLTVDQARRKAKVELGKAAVGRDPLRERQRRRSEEQQHQTVAQLADRYLEYAASRKKPKSLVNDRQMIRDYVKPLLGKRLITEIRTAHIVEVHQSLRDKPYAANRLLALLTRMFNLARLWDDRPAGKELHNPCRGVEKFKEEQRERFLEPEELERLGEILCQVEREGRIPAAVLGHTKDVAVMASAVTAIRLLIFTGCRREEILGLRWDQVDFRQSRITLPDSKTGSRLFPVGAAAIETLAAASRREGNPYVCWGKKQGHHLVGLPKLWNHIRKAAKIEDVRIHDLRHTFGSVGVGAAGLNLPVVGKLLGHKRASTTQRYAHVATSPAKAAADLITTELAASLNGDQHDDALLAELISKAQGLSAAGRQRLVAALQG